jgi:methyltransferase (TIGR00027 family)
MDASRPSRTAQEVALYRAAHQLLDRPPVFHDPLALRIMGRATEAALRANPPRGNRSHASIRAFIAVRSRYAEDQLAQAVVRGVRQYVILGAGLDTFGYRNPHAAVGLRVFEVDHPATQVWKRQRLDEVNIEIPEWLSFAPVDLVGDALAHSLRKAGFRTDQPAFLAMLGVGIFMPEHALKQILNLVATLPSGSGIVFDYGIVDSSLDESQRAVREAAARNAAAIGEPFITFLDPAKLEADLRQMGFSHIDDCGFAAINRRYFEGRNDELRVGPGGRRLVGAYF